MSVSSMKKRSSRLVQERWHSTRSFAASDRGRGKIFACAAVALAILVAFGLRAFRLDVSWDIFIDEILYLRVSQGVLNTFWVTEGDSEPFYLHPPLFFFVEAAYMKLFRIDGDLIQQIYGVRYLGAAFAGLSAGTLLWIGRRLAGWPTGVAVAGIFALDPFSIRMDSRSMLDTPAVMWVLLGYGVLFSAIVRNGHRQISWRRVIVAGILFGLALLTKEKIAFVTLLPLGICFVLGWALPRIQGALIGAIALVVYACYPLAVYARGDWTTFVEQKSAGALRLAGVLQVTGFNQQGGPSLLDAVVHRLDEFATTYVFLVTGVVALVVLYLADLGNKNPARRLLIAWTASTYAFLGYSVTLGTLEEQFFYYLIVPSILSTTVATTVLLRKAREADAGRWPAASVLGARGWRRTRRALEVATAVGVAVLAIWSLYVWTSTHTVPDNAQQRVASYVERLPEEARVAVTEETAEFIVKDHAGDEPYESTQALRADNIDYVIVTSYLATEGYDTPPLGFYRWVQDHGQLVYGFEGRAQGLMGVWLLDSSAYARSSPTQDEPDAATRDTTDPDGARSTGASPTEKSDECRGNGDWCVRALVAEVAPKAEYVGGRIDVNVDGPASTRNVLYFEDPNTERCQHKQLVRTSADASTQYVAIIAGEGSFTAENEEGCVPGIGR